MRGKSLKWNLLISYFSASGSSPCCVRRGVLGLEHMKRAWVSPPQPPALSPSQDQSRVTRGVLGRGSPTPPPALRMLKVRLAWVLPRSPGSQRVPLPRIPTAPSHTPLWFSASAQNSREKQNQLVYLRSKYASTFPFPFSAFLQSACSGSHQLREAALHHPVIGQFKLLGIWQWGPACKFATY